MSKLFTSHSMTVQKYDIVYVNRQPVNKIVDVIADVPCRVTGTHNSNIKLFVLAEHYNTIPGGLHKNYVITVKGPFIQNYTISKEPVWAAGTRHHVECTLEETK